MAILKHIASKNADYGEAERYLIFQHDEYTQKPILDENGHTYDVTGFQNGADVTVKLDKEGNILSITTK